MITLNSMKFRLVFAVLMIASLSAFSQAEKRINVYSAYVFEDKVEPYGGLLLGAAIFNNKTPNPGEETSKVKFALGFRLGATVWVSDRVGIKLQTQFITSVQGIGGGFYFGTGGASAGASTYSTITQFTLGGGLAFKLGAQ